MSITPPILFMLAFHGNPATAADAKDIARHHRERPIVIAHRGASKIAPENTLAALGLAAELGAVAIEFDVHASEDGVPVLLHDATLARTTNGRGLVRKTPLSELRALDAGSWFSSNFSKEGVPTLREALETIGDQSVLCVEIKTKKPIVAAVAEDLRRSNAMDRTIIFSFKAEQLLASKELMPKVPTLLLAEPNAAGNYNAKDLVQRAHAVGARLLGLNHGAVHGALIKDIQGEGLPVFVYTVDAPEAVRKMVSFGVDGIISNQPRATLSRVYQVRPPSK